jgi:N-acetylneuraminic acid mutarotase
MRRGQQFRNLRNPYRLVLALSPAILAASLFALALTAPSWGVVDDPPGEWRTCAPSSVNRQEVSYAEVGGNFYLAGGTTLKLGMTLQERYDPMTNSWKTVAPLPKALTHIQAVELGGKIYYVGGMEGSTSGPHGPASDTVFVYDPATDSFGEGTPLPAGRDRGAAGTADYNGKIYIAGGQHDPPDGVYNPKSKPWFDVYNPATKSWTQLPDMPRKRDHFQGAVVDGKFYAIGGRDFLINATTTAVDVYDLSQGATGTWRTLDTALPTPRGGFATAVLGKEILVIGGEGGGIAHSEVEAYDTVTNTWRALEPIPTYGGGRHGTQAAVYDGGVYIAAGSNEQGTSPTNVHEAFFLNGSTTTTCKPLGDTTAPVVTKSPTQSLNANFALAATTVPVKIQWAATDSGGVAGYELEQSINGGAFTPVALPSATAKTITPKLAAGNTYSFQVRAKDQAGNLSAWEQGPTFKVNFLQESNSAIGYTGTWSTQSITSASGGTLKYASAAGNSASLTSISNALNIAWIAPKTTDRGKAEVRVDGTLASTVDLYSSTLQPRRSAFVKNSLDPAVAHTLEVGVLGTKNASSSGTRVDVDAFVVLEKVP